MVSITELPAELLVQIFRQLRDLHVESYSNGWLLVTHVCRDWRLVALDAAELWTQIYSVNPDCIQAFLTRSKSAPLYLRYPQQNPRGDHLADTVLPMLLAESSRFLRVELAHWNTAQAFSVHLFPGGTPLLRYLYLRYLTDPEAFPQGNIMAELAQGISRIRDHGLPALQRLRLERWPHADLALIRGLVTASLRTLEIKEPHMNARHSPSEWANILTGLPLLETLTLTHIFPLRSVSSAEQESMPHIHLPRLSSLRLAGNNLPDQLSLLQQITASSEVHITFVIRGPGSVIPLKRYMDTLRTIKQKFAREKNKKAICPTLFDLRLMHDMDENAFHGVETTLCVVPVDPDRFYCSRSACNGGVTPTLALSFSNLRATLHDLYPPLYDMLCPTFSWSALRKLSLSSSSSGSAGFAVCRNLFLQMTNLRMLTVSRSCLNDCLLPLLGAVEPLAGSRADDGTDHGLRVLFPVLEILTVRLDVDDGHDNKFEPLRDALLSRKAAGYPVSRVHICDSGIESDPGVLLRSAVAPLAALGCTVDVCVGKLGEVWRIEELVSAE